MLAPPPAVLQAGMWRQPTLGQQRRQRSGGLAVAVLCLLALTHGASAQGEALQEQRGGDACVARRLPAQRQRSHCLSCLSYRSRSAAGGRSALHIKHLISVAPAMPCLTLHLPALCRHL